MASRSSYAGFSACAQNDPRRAAGDYCGYRLLLPDQFVTLRQLLSQRVEFFFDRHALTLLPLTPLGKSPADLGSNT